MSSEEPRLTTDSEVEFTLVRPTLHDFVLSTVHSPSFPFLGINVKPDTRLEDYSVDIKVGTKLYEVIKRAYLRDELLTFVSINNGAMGFWSFDMLMSIKILSEIGILNQSRSWIMNARTSIANYLASIPVESKRGDQRKLEIAMDILRHANLLESVANNPLLPLVVKDAVAARKLDPDTIIYRLAMAIYHAQNSTGKPVIEEIEDPASIYLRLSQSDFFKKYEIQLSPLKELSIRMRSQVVKVMMTFVIGAYAYHKEARQ